MKTYKVVLEGTTPILFGKQYAVPMLEREKKDEYELRTWRERAHQDADGNVVLGPLMLKNCLRDAARYLSENIPGKGKSTYTKHFKSGIAVFDSIKLADANGKPIPVSSIQPLWLNVPSDGQTGGTKRVPKAFPKVDEGWRGEAVIHVLDELISLDVLKRHLVQAGNFVGLGAMRVGNSGISGRFKIVSLQEAK